MANGLYRFRRENGEVWVATDEPRDPGAQLVYFKDTYISLGLQPSFESLPSEEEYARTNPLKGPFK